MLVNTSVGCISFRWMNLSSSAVFKLAETAEEFKPTSSPEEFFGVSEKFSVSVTLGKFFFVPAKGLIAGKEELTGIVSNRL